MCLLVCNQWSVGKEKTGEQPYGFSAAEVHLTVSTLVFTQAAATTAGPSTAWRCSTSNNQVKGQISFLQVTIRWYLNILFPFSILCLCVQL